MKIAVLASGGVDSSLALKLLHEAGHDLTAFYLKVWLEDELDFLGECPWEEDLKYVRELCAATGTPLEVLPMQQAYRDRIIAYALQEVRRGLTPNPDLMCNTLFKFGAFLEELDESYEKVATGHYAALGQANGLYELRVSPDPIKDQTYFLAGLNQRQLSRSLFPIGEYHKSEVRELARKFALPSMERKDSQGLCFLGKIRFRDFIKAYLGEKPGVFVEEESGAELGRHLGYWFYTLGQRRGMGLSGGPWYVTRKDPAENIVYLSRNYFENEKKRNEFQTARAHWIAERPPEPGTLLRVKLRHGPESYECDWEAGEDGGLSVRIQGRDQGIAPGQFAVFYDGRVCLGSAAIL